MHKMASAFTKAPTLRVAAARGYAQAAPIAGSHTYDIKTTNLSNRMVVSSADTGSPLTRVSICFRAGSRYETPDNLGTTHVLRAAAGTSTKCWSQFAITRRVQQQGATITCTSDRELVAYTLEGTRGAVAQCIPYLSSIASEQLFYPWEVADQNNRLRAELATRAPQWRAIDLLHKAAFRKGLGNSLYIAKYNIGRINSETLQHYVKRNCTANRCAVIGVGIDHATLESIAQDLNLESGADDYGASPYKGGEIRSDKGGDMAYIAIAGEGAAYGKKEGLAFAVLQGAMGTGPATKYGSESSSLFRKAIGDISEPHSIAAINTSYSDTGLFGVLLAAPANLAGKLVPSVVSALKSGNVSANDIKRGKNRLITEILTSSESGSRTIANMRQQAILCAGVQSPSEMVDAVSGISDADVQAAAKKLAGSPLTIAAVGNLSCVPFRDEL